MTYAAATQRGGRPGQRRQDQPRPPPPPLPMHHLSYLYKLSFLVDFKAVRPNATIPELGDFLLKDLKLPPLEVASFYVDHALQQLLVTVESEQVFRAALDALHAGVPWALAGGSLTHGWATTETLTSVRVSHVPPYVSPDVIVARMARYGRVVYTQRGFHRPFPKCANGVLHLSMHLDPAAVLPGYLQLTDMRGNLCATLPVHMDGGRRVCYRCGGPSHVAQWCRAQDVLPDASGAGRG